MKNLFTDSLQIWFRYRLSTSSLYMNKFHVDPRSGAAIGVVRSRRLRSLILLLSQGRPSHQNGGKSNIGSIWGDANHFGLDCVDLAYLSGSL
ncbi:Hypothetical protein FKW44_020880 [Caligus rogercresseyi]|uniref:Uncharacterized protein n=1 Tax=Caligus rogercresseyi TaxID=217165 RepID=A0A7T8GQJ7_CALRO|nr:Hypothetical protein FKW44_020880 [Caligus rogercresseyi]